MRGTLFDLEPGQPPPDLRAHPWCFRGRQEGQEMCGRIIQASGPLRFAIVEGLNVVDSRYANLPPRYNGAPSQDILVIRQNHETGERSLDPLRWGPHSVLVQ